MYAAPEIHARKTYDGAKTDIFALGVILYIMVRSSFPFKFPTKDDSYYSLIITG